MDQRKGLSVQPLYLQVRALLLERIAVGQWKPGASVPNELEIARELGVSSGTVRKALASMEDDRLIVRRRGRGTFVVDHALGEPAIRYSNIRDSMGTRISGQFRLINQVVADADAMEQERLRVQPGDLVVRTIRVRDFDDRPFMHEASSIALSRIPGCDGTVAADYRMTAVAQQHGVHLGRAWERVAIANAPAEIAERLGVPAAASLMLLERVIHSMDGHPIEWRMAHCHLGSQQSYMADMV